MKTRELESIIASVPTSDGAGVKLRRSLGSRQALRHDPFLMLDEFYSDNPNDYLAGFPSHPHRGFETVTYMLDGHMQHKDNQGNTGDLGPGDVQWMRAASGIIHSEMPQQADGRMRGFQLWLNLPAREKMTPAAYRDISAGEIPTVRLAAGVEVRLIAGHLDDKTGPIHGGSTDPYFYDVHLMPDTIFETSLPNGHNVFVYVYEGDARTGDADKAVPRRAAALLGSGDQIRLSTGADGARVLVLSGQPLREPIVQYGPFVMNTREEIDQAISDYQTGRLTREHIRHIKIS